VVHLVFYQHFVPNGTSSTLHLGIILRYSFKNKRSFAENPEKSRQHNRPFTYWFTQKMSFQKNIFGYILSFQKNTVSLQRENILKNGKFIHNVLPTFEQD
jgi:hypothetical protein